ncbi:unnamed protein product [Rhizoctonia solani]|uniref:Uncharacterized protein n=1 Tax=Rhizoctonia solani TaxID=456999 RepID=A0A8H3EC29_9AGAM|nr:unnamed protein product [Rhizoctonia solani]
MRDTGDFPLSETTARAHSHTTLNLTSNHLQLAAQCPAQWTRSESEMRRASLARRKIVWRAILARYIHNTRESSSLSNKPPHRLGRLPDRVYVNWETFVRTACEKMGLPATMTEELLDGYSTDHGRSTIPLEAETLSFRLEILHILRALIGPVIESLIVLDRALYLAEQLGPHNGSSAFTVRALNLFDQLSSGSARNIVLIVEPTKEQTTHTS